ncbi:MAG: hypothetical protein NTU53_15940 [Planctomycetota bacterium]|nr:hypothetical protein [Planctomycetota bacterium]
MDKTRMDSLLDQVVQRMEEMVDEGALGIVAGERRGKDDDEEG